MQVRNYFGVVAISILMACNSTNKSTTATDTLSVEKVEGKVADLHIADEKLQTIFSAYIKLKDELVATNFDAAKPAATSLATLLKGYNGCENATILTQKIATAKNIAAQRKEFTSLNTELIPVFQHTVLTSGTIYVQHCPMANKGDGGDWLSTEKKIQNPYYGSEMMECGAVIAEVKAK
jgi:Protein of unknown function (DUF3347)